MPAQQRNETLRHTRRTGYTKFSHSVLISCDYRDAMGQIDRDRLDGLMYLSRLHFDRFQARRNWEWKLTFTLWATLAAAANALRNAEDLPLWLYALGAVFVVAMHAAWERFIEEETYRNRMLGVKIGHLIDEAVEFDPGEDNEGFRLDEPRRHLRSFAHYWQVGITLVLVAIVGAVLYL